MLRGFFGCCCCVDLIDVRLYLDFASHRKHSITYSTPMLHRWTTQRMIPLQAKNIEKNRVLLFIITKDSLDIASMILVSIWRAPSSVSLCLDVIVFFSPRSRPTTLDSATRWCCASRTSTLPHTSGTRYRYLHCLGNILVC